MKILVNILYIVAKAIVSIGLLFLSITIFHKYGYDVFGTSMLLTTASAFHWMFWPEIDVSKKK